MIKLAYHFKCDVLGCAVESGNHIGDVSHRMAIPEVPIPNGWHYLDHRIVCNAHSVVIDKKWLDAPAPVIAPIAPAEESASWADAANAVATKKANKTKTKKKK